MTVLYFIKSRCGVEKVKKRELRIRLAQCGSGRARNPNDGLSGMEGLTTSAPGIDWMDVRANVLYHSDAVTV